MRWTEGGTSSDVEDDRGGGGGFRPGGKTLGLGGILVLGALSLIFHQNFFALVGGSGGGDTSAQSGTPAAPATSTPTEDREVKFVSFVLDDIQATWTKNLPQSGVSYQHAKLHLYREGVQTGCGNASSAVGPFYCPADRKVYLDLGFFDELRGRFGAPGEFAEAYVIAHEVGHHVQNLLGISNKVRALQERNPSEVNPLSVKLELQADCFAGVWARSTDQRQILEKGDVESGLGAAASVGDDRLQKQSGRGVRPETWTHGSSAERVEWFKRGMAGGTIAACDTFAGR